MGSSIRAQWCLPRTLRSGHGAPSVAPPRPSNRPILSDASATAIAVASTPSATDQGQRPRLATSAASTYAVSLAVAAGSMVNVLITARYLGPLGRGHVAFVMSIAVVTSTFAGLGVDQANVNMASVEPGARRALATNSLLFAGVLGAAAAGLVALITVIAPGVTGNLPGFLLWLALGAVPFLVARTYLGALVEADYRFAISNAARLSAPLTGVLVNGLLAVAGALTATSASVTWVAGQLLGVLLLMWFVCTRSVGLGRPDADLGRRALGFGIRAHVARAMNIANYRLDQWFVGALAGSRELGRYSVAVAFSEVLFLLPTALAKVQRPDLVRASRAGAARKGAAVFRLAVLLTIPATAALIVAAPMLIVTLFGASFEGSIDDMRILLAGAFGVIAVKLLGDALTAQRRPMLSSVAVGFGFVVTVVLDILLIPSFGGLGAAIASTVAYSAGGIAAAVLFLRTLGGRPGDLRPRLADVANLRRVARRMARGAMRGASGRRRSEVKDVRPETNDL
jgi:O-antigen/teichoic acid export membrane protein